MRGFFFGLATACLMVMLASCGATETLGSRVEEHLSLNLPGVGSTTATPSTHPSTPTTSSSTPAGSSTSTAGFTIPQMLAKHNALRQQLGLGSLKMNSTLSKVAQNQAAYNASIGTISHADARGGQVWDRATAAGYMWTHIGENLADVSHLDKVFDLWVASPGHYRNMTDPSFKEIGIGKVTQGTHEFWCVVFATPQ